MPTVSVQRHPDAATLAANAAAALIRRLVEMQRDGRIVHLCLTGGRIANRIYEHIAGMVATSELDPGRLELWWGDERFVPTDDPMRHSLQALSRLAGSFPLDPARTHPIPSTDAFADSHAAAYAYARELSGTTIDICLLGIGEDGHVASLFPDHPSFEPTQSLVIGVTDPPKPPERVSLTLSAINRSREVWIFSSGAEKAGPVSRALRGDPAAPAAHVHGVERTLWFLDEDAAAQVPYHECGL
jgi:6-phosphogluconolactonase